MAFWGYTERDYYGRGISRVVLLRVVGLRSLQTEWRSKLPRRYTDVGERRERLE